MVFGPQTLKNIAMATVLNCIANPMLLTAIFFEKSLHLLPGQIFVHLSIMNLNLNTVTVNFVFLGDHCLCVKP